MDAVVDTNVIFSGLMSRKGASFQILQWIRDGRLRPVLSVALLEEYLDVLGRQPLSDTFGSEERDDFADFMCSTGLLTEVFFLWRPGLRDPKDDMVLEAAVASGANLIVTHNLRDFAGASSFGVRVVSPADLINQKKDRK